LLKDSMRPPAFWQHPSSVFSTLLAPLGWLYDILGKWLRRRITPERVSIPVICVGNATLGGSGKTPVVAELARRLRAANIDAHILSRGYGGKTVGPLLVDGNIHTSKDVGDEPRMLSSIAPVWVSASKVAGAKAAAAAGAKLILMDDGLQNPTLHKDYSFLVVDGGGAFGNGRIFPAGPLREYPQEVMKRVDAVVFIGEETVPPDIAATRKTFLRALPRTMPPQELRGKAVLAFCGIGRPQKFFDGLKAQGVKILAQKAFPDHHPYSHEDIEKLIEEASRMNVLPVTTEKDAARIPRDLLPRITVCGFRLIWQDEPGVESLMRRLHELVR
jgi:tetraacyldisaccharide 4'-kinase